MRTGPTIALDLERERWGSTECADEALGTRTW